jgi:maleylacetoacetate isomerase
MADTDRFELFSYWRTSATYRVRVAFNLKGVRPRETNVDMDAGEQIGEAFLRVNPLGAIPALIDHADGQSHVPLTQSLAILEFIDESYPRPPLLPTDAHGRARVRSLAQMLASDTHPLITPRVRKYLTANAGFDAERWRAWQLQWFGTGLRAVEERLAREPGTGRFCHGDAPTMADICLASIFAVTRVLKIEFDDLPIAHRIMAECETLEAFAAADPARQAGAPRG